MNNVSISHSQNVQALKASYKSTNIAQNSSLSFRASESNDTLSRAADAAREVVDKVKKDPDENTIKAGLSALLTVGLLYVAKSADKIKAFVDSSQKSPNKFVKTLGVVAGLAISLLSLIGASSLFKEKVQGEAPKNADDTDVDKPASSVGADEEEGELGSPTAARDMTRSRKPGSLIRPPVSPGRSEEED